MSILMSFLCDIPVFLFMYATVVTVMLAVAIIWVCVASVSGKL